MDGLIKIGDFGLVTDVLDDLNLKETCKTNPKIKLKHTNHVGTQLYMSPEQVIYRAFCVPSIDLFHFLTRYEMSHTITK